MEHILCNQLHVRPFSGTAVYPHMPILYAWPAHGVVTNWPICPLLGFWESNFTKRGDSLPWMQMNRRAKFDATSFILGGEIRNRTNTHALQHGDRIVTT